MSGSEKLPFRNSRVKHGSLHPQKIKLGTKSVLIVLNMIDLTKSNSKGTDDDDEAYEFPLFSKRYSSQSTVPATQNLHRISLRSPTPKDSELGFLISQRPDAYYFTPPASPEKLERYREAAVTGKDVKKALQQKWVDLDRIFPWQRHLLTLLSAWL